MKEMTYKMMPRTLYVYLYAERLCMYTRIPVFSVCVIFSITILRCSSLILCLTDWGDSPLTFSISNTYHSEDAFSHKILATNVAIAEVARENCNTMMSWHLVSIFVSDYVVVCRYYSLWWISMLIMQFVLFTFYV